MEAYLKEIKRLNQNGAPFHPIAMIFGNTMEDVNNYVYKTTIETQFGLKRGEDYSESILEDYYTSLEQNIGKKHIINIYDITFKEMSKGKYLAFRNNSYLANNTEKKHFIFYRASYKQKEDVILDEASLISMMCLQGDIMGIKEDGSEEEITNPKAVFFEEEKIFVVSDEEINKISDDFIANLADTNTISIGSNLLDTRKYISCRKVYDLTYKINCYRKNISEVERRNNSLSAKLFFWKPKEKMPELDCTRVELRMLKESYLFGKNFHDECMKINRKKLEDSCGVSSGPFSHSSKDIRLYIIEQSKTRNKKYHGMGKIETI